jgi:translation initiation factor 4E
MASRSRLTSDWKFWLILFTRGGRQQWEIEEIAGVSTLDLFFREFLRLPKPSSLKDTREKRPTLAFFKNDVQPAWEDTHNKRGGAYYLLVKEDEVDAVWKDLLFYAVGGNLTPGHCSFLKDDDDVNGILVRPKKGNHEWGIDIWTKGVDADLPLFIEFLQQLPAPPRGADAVEFKPHQV